jgi:hypothetical protein
MRAVGGSSLIPSAAFGLASGALGPGIGVALGPEDAKSCRDRKGDGLCSWHAKEPEDTSDSSTDIGRASGLVPQRNAHHVSPIAARCHRAARGTCEERDGHEHCEHKQPE